MIIESLCNLIYSNFTFQSGSIQMKTLQQYRTSLVGFTFQSGSIQMIIFRISCSTFTDFTFQSGSIQIRAEYESKYPEKMPLHSNLVLFKYCGTWRHFFQVILYIPIWFYSNLA